MLPGQSVDDIVQLVNACAANARTLGLIGLVGIVCGRRSGCCRRSSSALNIIYEVPNRAVPAAEGRQTLVLVLGSIIGLFTLLTVVDDAVGLAKSHASTSSALLSIERRCSG